MQVSEEVIEAAAKALALCDDYDGCFERIEAWDAASDQERACGEVEEPMSWDEEEAEVWRRRAREVAPILIAEGIRLAREAVASLPELASGRGKALAAIDALGKDEK